MSNPIKKHREAMKGVMRYLNDTKNMCICFDKKEACVVGYTNLDYARDLDNRRSTYGYVFTFIGGAISSQSCL